MPLTNKQLRYYDSNVLRLPADKRTAYHKQVDRLISELSKSIRENTDLKVTKVVKAGSFAKFTILRKTSTDPVDVDVVFYIESNSVDNEALQTLNDRIYKFLIDIYPMKSVEDFEIKRKASKISFVGTGLDVDIVPVITDEDHDDYGLQYDLQDSTLTETCAPCQIKFVRDRKKVDSDFRTLVRMAKRWRNYAELSHLKSFHLELILAYVLDQEGFDGLIEQRFRRFLLYISQSELKEIISFPENSLPLGQFSDPVVIIDPVCSTNNTASRISESERKEIVKAADKAWETANFASVEDDIEIWKELFGPQFKVEDAS